MVQYRYRKVVAVAVMVSLLVVQPFLGVSQAMASPSAGLAWGPVTVGNLQFKVSNVHYGYAGPKVGNADHFNVYVDRKDSRGQYTIRVANYHVSTSNTGNSWCVYVWDSVSEKTILDACSNDPMTLAQQAASAIRSTLQTLLSNADWIATTAIIGVLTLVIIDLIVPGDPIPIIPFSVPKISLSPFSDSLTLFKGE